MQMCYSSYCQCKSFSLPCLRLPFPSLCPSSTVVTTHRIFAGKSLPMASVSTWCVKFWAGQSARAWQCCVPCQGCPSAWDSVPMGPTWKSEALRPLKYPVGTTLLRNTLGTFLCLAGCGICCLRVSKSSLDEKSLPEQCHRGLQSYSGGGEVPTVILSSFTYKKLPKETWRIEDSFSLAAKLKNL